MNPIDAMAMVHDLHSFKIVQLYNVNELNLPLSCRMRHWMRLGRALVGDLDFVSILTEAFGVDGPVA